MRGTGVGGLFLIEVLAAAVAERARMPFEDYLRDGVLFPLGMMATKPRDRVGGAVD